MKQRSTEKLSVCNLLSGILVLGGAFVTTSLINAESAFAEVQNGRITYSASGIIRSINPDGTGQTQPTTEYGFQPYCSPDGLKIAYIGSSLDVRVMNSDGTGDFNLTNHSPGEIQQSDSPAWSPDGTKVIYSAIDTSNFSGLFVINADGTGRHRLTTTELGYGFDHSASWSPDGSKILFQRGSSLYLINADGSNLQNLTEADYSAGISNYDPTWSPDGSKILFGSDRLSTPENYPFIEIFTMSVNGSNLTRLTNNSMLEKEATYSPDGNKIVFEDHLEGSLYVMDAAGTNIIKIVPGTESYNTSPSWARTAVNVNTAPNALNDTYVLNSMRNKTLSINSPGVLINDIDAEGNPLSVALVTSPSRGKLTMSAAGSFSYKADSLKRSTDTFTYKVFDGQLWSEPATVTIKINPKKTKGKD